jgi:hypothetical protein
LVWDIGQVPSRNFDWLPFTLHSLLSGRLLRSFNDDAADEDDPECGARADGEGDEMGQLGGDEMRHPR